VVHVQGGSFNERQSHKKELERGKAVLFFAIRIKHLYYECFYAKFIWDLSQVAFNIAPLHSVRNMFGTWLHQFA
jgi:hypothetical protein